jgi:hypothetical protein
VNVFRRLGSIPGPFSGFRGRASVVWCLAVLLALTTAAGISARNLRFDFNPEAVFGGDNRGRQVR